MPILKQQGLAWKESGYDRLAASTGYHLVSTHYSLDNRPLIIVDHCKNLGVVLQSNLNSAKHIEEKIAKANTTWAMIRKNLKTSIQTKDLAYHALVRPQLEYGSVGNMVQLRKYNIVVKDL